MNRTRLLSIVAAALGTASLAHGTFVFNADAFDDPGIASLEGSFTDLSIIFTPDDITVDFVNLHVTLTDSTGGMYAFGPSDIEVAAVSIDFGPKGPVISEMIIGGVVNGADTIVPGTPDFIVAFGPDFELGFEQTVSIDDAIATVPGAGLGSSGGTFGPLNKCPGDYNGDDMVDFDDLNVVLGSWNVDYDFDDLNAVLSNWLNDCTMP